MIATKKTTIRKMLLNGLKKERTPKIKREGTINSSLKGNKRTTQDTRIKIINNNRFNRINISRIKESLKQ